MENKKNTFEGMADTAEQTLKKTEESIVAAMRKIDSTKYNEISEKLVEAKAEELVRFFDTNEEEIEKFGEPEFFTFFDEAFPAFLKNFPPNLAEDLIKNIAKNEDFLAKNIGGKNEMLSSLLLFFGRLNEKKGEDTTPHVLSMKLSSDDFPEPLGYFGAYLPKSSLFEMDGDVGPRAGFHLDGGTIIIDGKAGNLAGMGMKSGHLIIKGEAGMATGIGMFGGILSLESGAKTLLLSHVSKSDIPANIGKIIWKGITIWDNGWTPIGQEMCESGEIRIQHS